MVRMANVLVLMNYVKHHSLWPTFVDVAVGWRVVHGPPGRNDCLAVVNTHWTDMGPFGVPQIAR